jgi:5-methylcytosine-specific restriction protein A
MSPFERGKVYRRVQDIHQRFGGQRQGGISTPSSHPYIFLFTGESGSSYGYNDDFSPTGHSGTQGKDKSGT